MKRTLSAILSAMLLLSVILSALVLPASAEGHLKKDKGLTIDSFKQSNKSYATDYYESPKLLEEGPRTFEAWVYLSSSISGSAPGIIIGTDPDRSGGRFTFGIGTDFAPYIMTNTRAGVKHRIDFKNDTEPETGVRQSYIDFNTWTQVVIVCDEAEAEFRCYLNGELKGTAPFSDSCGEKCADGCLGVLPYDAFTTYPLCLAGDHRHLNSSYFKGSLQDVALYADALTEEEIRSSYNYGVNKDDENLILYYDIDASDKRSDIPDLSGNGYDMLYGPLWLTEEEMQKVREEKGFSEDYAYSIAVIGDIQYSTRLYPSTVRTMYQWIVNNQENKNILYAIGVGDITDNCSIAEWNEAADALKIFENAGFEYSLVRGNHDKGNGGDYSKEEPALHLYDELFANNEFYTKQFDEHGGYYKEGSVVNTYRTVNWGGTDRLLINIDWSPSSDVLAWACGVVEQYPTHKVIIVTHENLYPDAEKRTVGNKIWDELASKYENVEMVLSGHCSYNDLVVKQEEGVNGNTVTQMLIDPQRVDLMLNGMGIVTMFYFREDGTTIDVEHYSTVKNRYLREVNQFTVDLTAESEPPEEYWDGVTSTAPKGTGTESDPYLIAHPSNLLWMAEQHYTYDSDGNVTVPDGAVNPFDGKYFRQTRDINLCGKTLYSIGYYYETAEKCAVFGGNYDGGGYSIMNATVKNPLSENGSLTISSGIFGEICGASIKNLNAKELTLTLSNNVGFIVGRSNASGSGEKTNLIDGCTVDVSSRLTSKAVTTKNVSLGAIVGSTRDTTICNSQTSANISLTATDIALGSIVGAAYDKTLIYDSVSGGSITLKCSNTAKSAVGGIVGKALGNTTAAFCTVKSDISISGAETHNSASAAGLVADGAALIAINNKNKTSLTTEAVYENEGSYVQHAFTSPQKCDTGHTVSCSCGCGASITLPHKANEYGYCEHCEVRISGATVTLGESISIKYYALITNTSILNGKTPVMEFTFAGNTVVVDGKLDGDEYAFILEGITPKQLGDSIDAALTVTDGDAKTVLTTKNGYSVKQNCLSVLSENADNTKAVSLVNDLLIYGDTVQRYTAYKTDSLICSGANPTPSELMPAATDKLSITKNNFDDCKVADKGVNFDTVPTVFIKLHITDLSAAEIKLNGKTYDKTKLENLGEGNYMLSLPLAMAESFAENYTLELFYNGNAHTKFVYGLNAFAYTNTSSAIITNEELYSLSLAAYRYLASVKAYTNV